MADSPRTIHQPIHPSVRAKLDPEYVALHDSIIQYMEPSEARPWDPASRSAPNPLAHTTQKLSPVGKQWDEDIGGDIHVRVFVPEGQAPSEEAGWPCLVWLHGGGWVNDVKCVVVTINYRHAPEHVYPAAVDDCLTGLRWLYEPSNASRLGINTSLVTIGGWSATRHVPWLTPTRMGWYQDLYFSRGDLDKKQWQASPCFAPRELLAKSPKTWLAVAGVDLLTTEGLAYAELLKENGVEVETEVVHQISRKLVHDACAMLAKGFGTSYDPAAAPILSQDE
ncbi:uncharacterized protein N0V96_001221 [Colletotrichum fioriniae]|uniref:uncharacterized protein n=1 Tax=Colletotrichum fioriniae TaxID=710243 RepID=UPI0032D9C59A|nr:hypothetical protein N0V96_001221 [Colletotrichum fioriniae]